MCSKTLITATMAMVTLVGTGTAGQLANGPNPTPTYPAEQTGAYIGNPMDMLVLTQSSAEEKSWELLGDTPSSLGLMLFLDKHPKGTYALEAKRRLAEVLASEVDEAAEAEAKIIKEIETNTGGAQVENVAAAAAAAPKTNIVKFDAPLFHGESHIKGKTLKELITGTPLFPPVADLPEEYWKTQTCASCHTWEKANLCEQAGFYLRADGEASLTKQHPYGGTFKENLRDWATNDCQ